MKPIHQGGQPDNIWPRCNHIRRMAWIYLSLLALPASMLAATINGFVTHIDSPTEIEIGTMRVLITPQTSCSFEALSKRTRSKHATLASQCNLSQMTIGSRVKLTGQFTKEENFSATHLELSKGYDPGESHLFLMFHRPAPGLLIGETLNEEAPKITRSTHGWNGLWWIDGYPMTVNVQTKFLSSPSSEIVGHLFINAIPMHSKTYTNNVHELKSSSLLRSNTWVLYHAKPGLDGALIASQIRLWPNQVSADEKQFLAKHIANIKLPDYERSISGTIQYANGSPIQILPNQAVQEYVSGLGMTLVPEYQKEMPTHDPSKVDFHFYVVRAFMNMPGNNLTAVDGALLPLRPGLQTYHHRYQAPSYYANVKTVVEMPNGVVLVPDVVLACMQNQAQMAALLSYAITSILQKQSYLAWLSITGPGSLGGPDDLHDIERDEDEQLLRIGIRKMYLAGYDIREAPFAWAVAQGKPVNNPVIDSKNPDKEIPWYATYAFNEISQYYKDVDYSKLKRGEAEYQDFLKELYKADPSLKQTKTQAAKQ